nr:retrovirus-related Pol polyprotein from transposon TNT 1-94 [Tanacetum cinerariifolium]
MVEDEISFEKAVARLTAYKERIKSHDTLEANDQDKLLMESSNNKTYGKWRGKDFNKEGKDSMKWKNNPNARRASTSQRTKDKSKLRCYECGEHEHFTKECTKWKYNKQEEWKELRVFNPSDWNASGMDGTLYAAQELKTCLEGLARHLFVSDNKVQRLVDRKGVLKLRFLSKYLRQRKVSRGSFGVVFLEEAEGFSAWATSALILCLGDRVLREITKETTAMGIWKKLEPLYMTKSLANRLYLKKKLYTFQMHQSKSQSKHIDEFHKLVGDLAAIDTAILDEDQTLLLLTSLPPSYDNFVETLLYGRDTLKLEDVLATIVGTLENDRSKGNEDQVSGFGADKYANVDVIMAMSVKQLLDWIMDSRGSYHMAYKRDYLFDFEEYNGGNVLLSDSRKCHAVIKKTLKGRKQLEEYQAAWKIKIDNVLDSCNPRQGMLEPVKVKCIFLGYHDGIVGDNIWRLDSTLKGVEFEVEQQEDHAFEVEPQGNVDHVGLKEDMDARSNIYVLSNGCKESSDNNNDYYWEYTPAKRNVLGMKIIRDQSGNTLRVSQSSFYNEKVLQTLLKGYSILSLKGSLSRDCVVENNGGYLVKGTLWRVRSRTKYPPCYKDMSFWINDSFTENNLCEIIRGVAGDLAEEWNVRDQVQSQMNIEL